MSASPTFMFCLAQFDDRAAEYVAAANPVHRAEFQADVDGARRVLLSEHFAKFRKEFPPDPPPQRTVLPRADQPGLDKTLGIKPTTVPHR